MSCSPVKLRLLLVCLAAAAPHAYGATADKEQARQALQALGAALEGTSGPCAECHALDPETLAGWAKTARDLRATCLDKPELSALEKVTCLKPFDPKTLGLLAAGTQGVEFKKIFDEAYGEQSATPYQEFLDKSSMPVAAEKRLSEAKFASVNAWMLAGAPFLDELLSVPPRIDGCVDESSAALAKHATDFDQHGWSAVNAERQMRPFACPTGPDSCFTQTLSDGTAIFPRAQDVPWARGWAERSVDANFRIIQDNVTYAYWIRSSPDGRYLGSMGRVYDLAGQIPGMSARREISVNSTFDPNFFPDGSGFSFLDAQQVPVFCPQGVLTNPTALSIDISKAPCTTFNQMDQYLYLGATVDGSDYVALSGSHVNNGGQKAGDPSGAFAQNSALDLYTMVNDGQSFQLSDSQSMNMPYEGDWAMSASGTLAVSRWSASGVPNSQAGYRLHEIGMGSGALHADKIGQVCLRGAKASVSYDENIMAVHHFAFTEDFAEFGYADADAPAFKEMVAAGTSNIYIADLKTGQKQRVTRLEPGQWAMFPHFRSDGWLYFLIRDTRANKTYAVATDAGIRLKASR